MFFISLVVQKAYHTSMLSRYVYRSGKTLARSSHRIIVPLRRLSLGQRPCEVRGLVLGVFSKEKSSNFEYTRATKDFDNKTGGKLTTLLTSCQPDVFTDEIKQRVFYNLSNEYPLVSVVRINETDKKLFELEDISAENESVRIAVATGIKALTEAGALSIDVDDFGNQECAAESANLVTFVYDELKSKKKKKVEVDLYGDKKKDWECGLIKATSQRFAMVLTESPSNILTPTEFAKRVKEMLQSVPSTSVEVRDLKWIQEMKMGAFYSVAKGSHENPCLVEICYTGRTDNEQPIVLVGKGVTFDSGGISLKPAAAMDEMRGDMGGAAVVAASIYGAAALNLNINIRGIIPLCENMPGGGSLKPGDVVIAKNGKSIQIDNTDAEGRLILADALVHAQSYNPAIIIDVATLTGAVVIALGSAASAVFTNTLDFLKILKKASYETGDRVWHMPLFKQYTDMIRKSQLADLNNISKLRDAGSCTAAAFLKEFVGNCKWMHIDIAGVFIHDSDIPYIRKGMTGRPTRTLIEFLKLCSEKR